MNRLSDYLTEWERNPTRDNAEKTKVQTYLNKLQTESNQVYLNISNDNEIPDYILERFFTHIIGVPNTSPAIDVWREFCYHDENARPGRDRTEANTATLGCLKSRNAVIEALDHSPVATALPGSTEAFLNQVLNATTLDQQRYLVSGKPITHPSRTVWGWFQPNQTGDPYHGISRNRDLVRRLGLSYSLTEQLVTWAHMAPNGECPKWPTAIDAGPNHLYRPGGKTHPTTTIATGQLDGLDEVVHSPLTGTNLAAEMRMLP